MNRQWPHLSEKYLDLLHLGDLINLNSSIRDVQADILKGAMSVFNAESGQFCFHNTGVCTPDKNNTALINLSWKYTDKYIEYYHDIDPFIRVVPAVGAFRDVDIMPRPVWQNNEFNYDFIQPQKIRHLLVIHLHNSYGIAGHIGLHRYDACSFSQKDLFKARFLSTMFSRNLIQKQLIQKLVNLEKLIKNIMVIPSMGVVVLDSSLHPVYWNARTLEIRLDYLNQQAVTNEICQFGPFLPQEILEECGRIRKSLVNKPGSTQTNRQMSLWTGPGERLHIEIVVLPADQDTSESSDSFYFIVILNKVHRVNLNKQTQAYSCEKLTPKENEIAQYISQGLTNNEISKKLFISLSTVATHVQHIFQKMGVKNRSRLVRRLLS